MLVIARRAQESLVIPCIQATVRVVAIHAGSVRLGVEAPKAVGVYREELYERLVATGQTPAPPTLPGGREHRVRNHLDHLTLMLTMLRRQLGSCGAPGTQALLERAAEECAALRQQLDVLFDGEVDGAAPVALGGAGI
jgi:carbon storage regulator CsrA